MIMSRILKVRGKRTLQQSKPKAEADNPYGDLDYSEYHKLHPIIVYSILSGCACVWRIQCPINDFLMY